MAQAVALLLLLLLHSHRAFLYLRRHCCLELLAVLLLRLLTYYKLTVNSLSLSLFLLLTALQFLQEVSHSVLSHMSRRMTLTLHLLPQFKYLSLQFQRLLKFSELAMRCCHVIECSHSKSVLHSLNLHPQVIHTLQHLQRFSKLSLST